MPDETSSKDIDFPVAGLIYARLHLRREIISCPYHKYSSIKGIAISTNIKFWITHSILDNLKMDGI